MVSIIGVKPSSPADRFTPDVTVADSVSLSKFTAINPGSRVTVSLSIVEGNANIFVIKPTSAPPNALMP